MLTAEIEMILADFCQTALCRSYLNSGRFICVGMTTDFILCNSSHHMLLMRPSILSNVSHCIISVIKFQSQFRLLARLQVAFVTLPVGEGLTPPGSLTLPRRLSICSEAGQHDLQTPITLQRVNLCEVSSPIHTDS